jgi:uncharacterized protein involved in cysteine biosynthesis
LQASVQPSLLSQPSCGLLDHAALSDTAVARRITFARVAQICGLIQNPVPFITQTAASVLTMLETQLMAAKSFAANSVNQHQFGTAFRHPWK